MHCQRTIPTLVITATISIKPALTKPAPPTNQRFPLEICNQDGSRYATLALQHTRRTSGTAQETWKLFERATPKVKIKQTNVRVLFAREIVTRFLADAKLLEGLVARDGIEPPTPAFSGPRSTN